MVSLTLVKSWFHLIFVLVYSSSVEDSVSNAIFINCQWKLYLPGAYDALCC